MLTHTTILIHTRSAHTHTHTYRHTHAHTHTDCLVDMVSSPVLRKIASCAHDGVRVLDMNDWKVPSIV